MASKQHTYTEEVNKSMRALVLVLPAALLVGIVAGLSIVIARHMTRSLRTTIKDQGESITTLQQENAELRRDEGEQIAELRRQRDLLSSVLDSTESLLRNETVPGSFETRPIHIYVADIIRDNRPRNREV